MDEDAAVVDEDAVGAVKEEEDALVDAVVDAVVDVVVGRENADVDVVDLPGDVDVEDVGDLHRI